MELTLLRNTQAGTSTGQTDAFIDLPKDVTLVIHAPPADLEGGVWNIIGARFFKVDTSNIKKQKSTAIEALDNSSLATFQSVFLKNNGKPKKLPDGIIVTIGTDQQLMTVTDSGPAKQNYEFLVWIQKDGNENINDYVDPGVRNDWN